MTRISTTRIIARFATAKLPALTIASALAIRFLEFLHENPLNIILERRFFIKSVLEYRVINY